MINRAHRFHGYSGLRGMYQRGQTVRGAQLSLKYAFRDPKRPYRLAVVVSRKVSKSAVVRNRIRRRVYELVRQEEAKLPAGIDLVLTVFSAELAIVDDKQLRATLDNVLGKAIHDRPKPTS